MARIRDQGARRQARRISGALALSMLLLGSSAGAQAPPATAPPAGAQPAPQGAAATPPQQQQGATTPPPQGSAPPGTVRVPGATPGQAGSAAPPAPPSVPQLSAPRVVDRSAPKAAPPRRSAGKPAGKPPRSARHKKKDKQERPRPITGPVATYPGFRMLEDGSSRVFVTVSKKVGISEHKAQGRMVYRLKGVQAPIRTNRLPLLTAFFPTPVGRVQLVEQGEDVDLVIELRAPSEAKHRVIERDGTILLQVDFPRAENLAVAPPTSAGPEPSRAKRTTQPTALGGGSGY